MIIKPYAEFKYSDYFETELPIEWSEKRLSYISAYDRNAFVDGPFGSDLKSSDYKDTGIPLIQLNNIRDGKHVLHNFKFISDKKKQELARHIALPKDIVIAKMADPVARSAIVSAEYGEYVIVADCVKLTPDLKLVDLSYLNWAINSELVKSQAELVSSGTTRIRISLGELKKLKIPYPSLAEQTQIANFLDYETTKIDTLIEKQQRLIELLTEKRQAVISHAVTKGLNPDVPMKDSGVEWLGEVPEHWEMKKLKHIGEAKNGLTYSPNDVTDADSGTLVLRSSNIQNAKLAFNDNVFVNVKIPKRMRTIKDDILICSRNGSRRLIGKNALITDEAAGQAFGAFMIVFRSDINTYLYWVLNSPLFEYQSGSFLTSTINQLTMGNLHNMEVPIPSREEQKEIINFLTKKMKGFDDLLFKAQQAIKLMQERRTALISAAVIGKIDVRDWARPE